MPQLIPWIRSVTRFFALALFATRFGQFVTMSVACCCTTALIPSAAIAVERLTGEQPLFAEDDRALRAPLFTDESELLSIDFDVDADAEIEASDNTPSPNDAPQTDANTATIDDAPPFDSAGSSDAVDSAADSAPQPQDPFGTVVINSAPFDFFADDLLTDSEFDTTVLEPSDTGKFEESPQGNDPLLPALNDPFKNSLPIWEFDSLSDFTNSDPANSAATRRTPDLPLPDRTNSVETLRIPGSDLVPDITPRRFTPAGNFENVWIRISESFANRLAGRTDADSGPVSDCILGARVSGYQQTQTRLGIDFVPNSTSARIHLVLDGSTHSDTVGLKSQARVSTVGRHSFRLIKPVDFDGLKLHTNVPRASVAARNHTVDIKTPVSRIPLLGSIVDRQARRIAKQSRADSERIAAQRLTDRVVPEFNRRSNEALQTAAVRLHHELIPWLEKYKLRPRSQRASTDDQSLNYHAIMPRPITPAAGASAAASADMLASGRDIGLGVHESAINGVLDQLPFRGQSISGTQLQSLIVRLRRRTGQSTPQSNPALSVGPENGAVIADGDNLLTSMTLRLDDRQPFEFRLTSDGFVVTIRSSFRFSGGKVIPPHRIDVPYRIQLTDDSVQLTPGTVRVSAIREQDREPRLATLLGDNVQRMSQPITLRRTWTVPVEQRLVPFTIQELTTRAGWLEIGIDAATL